MNPNKLSLLTVDDLAARLGVHVLDLLWLVAHRDSYYVRRVKRKPSGGERVYFVPHGALKVVQRRIDRSLLKRFPVHDSIHSYRRGRDPLTNAALHVGAEVLVELDIKDCFPNIRPAKVEQMFLDRGFARPVATLLTELTTFADQLPQGPPSSPRIANQVLIPLARRISGVCTRHGLTPSLFGDNIYVSGPNRAAAVAKLLERIVEDEGYTLNREKSGVRRGGDPKIVTGIKVNTKLNVTEARFKEVRSLVYKASRYGFRGLFEGLSEKASKDKLHGMIGYVVRVNPARCKRLEHKFLAIP